jgi:hypothetical protein
MTNTAETDKDENTLYYEGEIQSALRACEHYLDKVIRVQSSDIHERARHHGLLVGQVVLLKRWLNSGQTDQLEEWCKVRFLTADSKFVIGAAAIWLIEQAR